MTEPTATHLLATDAALRRRLMGLARRWLGQGTDAEDMVQEAFLRTAHGGMPADDAGRQAWLTTVVHHLCIDLLRRQARHDEVLAQIGSPPVLDDQSPERLVEQAQGIEAALSYLIARLPPPDVAAVLLYEIFEMGHAELGALAGRSEAASRQHMHRTLRRLQGPADLTQRPFGARDDDDGDTLLSLCRMAIDQRHPGGLIALLQTMRPSALSAGTGSHFGAARSVGRGTTTELLLVQGRLTLAVRLGGVLLCLLPLGQEALGADVLAA
jgi:RNA polymerase sigma factor (sigma-70 family)